VLSAHRGGQTVVVGGAIIEANTERPFAVDVDLLEPIASALQERTDAAVSTGEGTRQLLRS
jgi:hypothetical protein